MNSSEFVQLCEQKSHTVEKDESALAWGSRMFTVMVVLGGLEEISDEIKDNLAEAMSRVPDEVLIAGTMNLMTLRSEGL